MLKSKHILCGDAETMLGALLDGLVDLTVLMARMFHFVCHGMVVRVRKT